MTTPRHSLLKRLDQTSDRMARMAAAHLIAAYPAYAGMPEEVLRQTVDIACLSVTRAVAGVMLTDPDALTVRSAGAQFARLGFDLHGVVAAFAAAVQGCVAHVRAAAESLSVPAADCLEIVGAPLVKNSAAVQFALAEGFACVLDMARRMGTTRAADFVAGLLFGTVDTSTLAKEAADLGADLENDVWGLVLLVAQREVPAALHEIAAALDAASGTWAGPLVAAPMPHVPILIRARRNLDWAGALAYVDAAADAAGVRTLAPPNTRPADQLVGWYTQAQRNLRYVDLGAGGVRLDASFLQLCHDAASLDPAKRADEFRTTLSPVVDDRRAAELLTVLDRIAMAGTYQAAATSFGPADSRWYWRRMRVVEGLTGKSWERHWDQVALCKAVLCRWYEAATPGAYNAAIYGPRPDLSTLRVVRR